MTRFNRGHAALLLTAILFGMAFLFQRHAAQQTMAASHFAAALWFMFWRLLTAALFLGICWRLLRLYQPHDDGRWLHYGSIGGLLMFGGMLFQQWGLAYTSVGKSGFLTGLYVVFVPIFALLGGQRQSRLIWLAVALSVLGLGCFLAVSSEDKVTAWNMGDTLTILCALCWAGQVLWSGVAVRHCNALAFSVGQLSGVAILTFFALLFTGNIALLSDWPQLGKVSWDILATGIGSSALAFFLQAIGQRKVPAAHAAVILSLESAFAMFFGWWLLDERVTLLMLTGSGLLFAAMLVAQADELKP